MRPGGGCELSVEVIAGSLLIFLARMVNVSMSTMRTVLGVRQKKRLATTIGFFESLIFVLVIGQVLQNPGNVANVLGYAGGFAAGTLAGLAIEEKLAIGYGTVRAISQDRGDEIARALFAAGYQATEVRGKGLGGRVHVITVVVERREIHHVTALMTEADTDAFVTVDTDTSVRHSHE